MDEHIPVHVPAAERLTMILETFDKIADRHYVWVERQAVNDNKPSCAPS